jgi:benzoyl-CoA reductase subunit B
MVDKGLERTIAERDHFEFLLKFLEESPYETSHLLIPLVKANLDHYKDTVRYIEEGKPIIASYFSNAPEIFAAMGIHWYCPVSAAFAGAGANPYLMNDLEGADKLAVSSDICTLLRMAMYYTEAGLLPRPTAIVGMIIPCDGIVALHEASRRSKEWRGIPMFAPDPPYFTDERSIDYFAQELRRMVDFLTEHTGQKLDIGRLREVVEVTNEQYKLWQEINELRRAVPCPFNCGV